MRRAVVLCATLLALAGCGGSSSPGDGGAAEGGRAITTAFGTAHVPAHPQRVVAIGWSDQDTAIALGVKPVGVVRTVDTPSGVGPWAAPGLGGAKPTVLQVTDGIPFEKVAALRPDLILAIQSGIDRDDYDKLSRIAPTVGYAAGRGKYLTPWPEQTELIGRALGQEAGARKLVADTRATIGRVRREHPQWRDKRFAYTGASTADALNVYTGDDVRIRLLEQLGFTVPDPIRKLSDGTHFFVPLSYERAGMLDQDVLLAWFLTPADQRTFLRLPAIRRLGVVRRGDVVTEDLTLAQALAAPTPTSIPWALQRLVPRLQSAVG